MMELPKYFYFRLHPAEKGTAVEIEDASDADVVEVVRCKDCKHYKRPHGCGYIDGMVTAQEDGFCSCAERGADGSDRQTGGN